MMSNHNEFSVKSVIFYYISFQAEVSITDYIRRHMRI